MRVAFVFLDLGEKMSKKIVATLLMVSSFTMPLAVQAKIEKPAKDWQLKTLKGIKSIKYGVAYDPDGSLLKVVDAGLAGLKVPAKSAPLVKEDSKDIGKDEARLKVFVDNRDKNQAWVGLAIKQKSQLSRDGAQSYDADTYAIGSLCDRSKAKDVIKELCAQFQEDMKANN